MDMPTTATDPQESAAPTPNAVTPIPKTGQSTGGGWKNRESLWVGIIVFLLGVIGQILLYVVPSEEFATSSSYADYQLIGSLRVCAEGAMYVGAVWVGVYLARWGLRGKKD